MSFLVGPNGIVYQADLGDDTARVAGSMEVYDPDPRWDHLRLSITEDPMANEEIQSTLPTLEASARAAPRASFARPRVRPIKHGKTGKTGKKMKRDRKAKKNRQREPDDGPRELSNKEYLRALKKLHVELVRLQEWVRYKGLKVCIVFEGRDGAGKGGTIKAITERVSPRVFRVIALPAPTEREKTQMYVQRYLPHLPAARRDRDLRPQLVQPRGRRARHGLRERRAGASTSSTRRRASRRTWSSRASSCSSTGSRSARTSRRAG
jgi:hypothetical protein